MTCLLLMPKNTLPATHRLKSKKQIDRLFSREGHVLFSEHLMFKYDWVEDIAEPMQVGFSVTKRKVKSAVKRNRLKRLAREAYRTQQHDVKALLESHQYHLVGMFIYTKPTEDYTLALAIQDVATILKKLHKIIDTKKERSL